MNTQGGSVSRAAGLALWVFLFGCHKEPPPVAMEFPPAPVTIARAKAQDVPLYLDSIGRCVAREVVSIQPQVSGRITEIHFTDGSDVKTRDLLFTIDPRPYQAQLDAAEASASQARATLDLAKLDFARATVLLERKATSQQDYDTYKNSLEVAEARLKQNLAAVETARLNLEYCSLRSPIDGRTGHRLVDLGNIVAANTGSLLVIERLDPIYVDFTVTENDLSAVQRNMAQGTLRVEVRLPDEPGNPRTGDVTFLDNAVQDATGTVKLRATVPNADRLLWPGQFVKVRLILANLRGAVLVPASAPQLSARGTFVYVVHDDRTSELRPVTVGQRQGEWVVIESGVKAGEEVVTAGHLRVIPGKKVRPEEPHPPDASPSSAREK
jgi:multidrug efflux system membrane fusion protein